MKIVQDYELPKDYITVSQAEQLVEDAINNRIAGVNALFVLKFNGDLISLSGRYYKFAYKTLGSVKNALSQKFGSDVAKALVENDIVVIEKVYM